MMKGGGGVQGLVLECPRRADDRATSVRTLCLHAELEHQRHSATSEAPFVETPSFEALVDVPEYYSSIYKYFPRFKMLQVCTATYSCILSGAR